MLGRIVAVTLVLGSLMASQAAFAQREVVVGRELPPGAYESYPVPERYGVPEHHYAIVNNRAVIFHPQTRRVIDVY
jgi:hypothetical protein